MTQVVSGQFPRTENIQHSAMAKRDHEEPKEHQSSTKGELGYTLIPPCMPRVCGSREPSLEALNFHHLFHIHILIVVRHKKMFPAIFSALTGLTELKLAQSTGTMPNCEYLAR